MKKSGLRHANPLPIPRRGGTRLIEGKSPKLGRRVRLFDYASFVSVRQTRLDEDEQAKSGVCRHPTMRQQLANEAGAMRGKPVKYIL